MYDNDDNNKTFKHRYYITPEHSNRRIRYQMHIDIRYRMKNERKVSRKTWIIEFKSNHTRISNSIRLNVKLSI